VHDLADPVVPEDRVVLVLAVDGEAAVAALLETEKFFLPEVPAPRAAD